MMTEDRIRGALDDLDRAQAQIAGALTNAATAENTIRCAQAELDEAKSRLEDAVTNATAMAMLSAVPVVDGKNAEVRKAQLEAFLLNDRNVQSARQQVALAEAALLDAETVAEQIRADARSATIGASLAQHRAELLAAWCHLLTGAAAEPALNYNW